MTDLNKFFKALSERAYKENDLSDVTYSMCESNKVFRQFFLDFFFRSFNIDAQAVTITREYATEWGRPDFYIRRGKELFIVEVKIWDGSHHFEQYKRILDEKNVEEDEKKNWKRLGYIANYEQVKKIVIKELEDGKSVAAEELCPVYTWKDFVLELEKFSCFDDPAISAYVEYVKRVCPYDDFKLDGQNLNLSGFNSVREFENAVVGAICALELEKPNDYNFSSYYKSPRYFISQHRVGHFFEFDLTVNKEKNKSSQKRVWGWIGAYYRNKGAVVCVEFEDRDGWGKPVCDKFREKVKDGCLRFYLTEKKDWKEDLKNFLRSVLECVVNGCNENISNDEDICEGAKDLLGMKILPCLLEQKFFAKNHKYEVCINGNDKVIFNLEISSGSDTEVPNSHCGRYFELKPIGEKQTEFKSVRGWIGAMYNKDKSGEPKLIVEIEKGFANTVLGNNANDWDDDNWGWKCKNVEITDDNEGVNNVVIKIENTIQSLFGQKSTISSVCSVGEN